MKIALVCSKYALEKKQAWLTNDLASAYIELGHDVFVYCLNWSGEEASTSFVDEIGVNVVFIKQPDWQGFLGRRLGLVFKWFISSWWAATKIKKLDVSFDLLIYFSPAVTTFGIVNKLKGQSKRVAMILWDFFPKYHQELNLLPNLSIINIVAKKQEERAVNFADLVGLMSPANVKYIDDYFGNYYGQKRVVIPLWGPQPPPMLSPSHKELLKEEWPTLPKNKVWAVMGGQMIPGRGLELLLNVAAILDVSDFDLLFVVAGDGVFKEWFVSEIDNRQLKNVVYIGSLNRGRYFSLLQASDIGLVFNSGYVTVPTFASKSIDYLRAALPMVVAIEPASDAGIMIEQEMQAGYNCDVTNPLDIRNKLMLLASSPDKCIQMGKNGYKYFVENMTAKSIASKLISELA